MTGEPAGNQRLTEAVPAQKARTSPSGSARGCGFTAGDWLFFFLLAVLIAWITAPTFSGTFRGDDYYHVHRTDRMLAGSGLLSMLSQTQADDERNEYGWNKFAFRSDVYRPGLDLSFAMDRVLYGFWYPGYRLTNELICYLSALVVYGIALTIFSSRATAALASVFFVFNPGHLVSLISMLANRTDSLVGLFVLSSFYLFLRYRKSASFPSLLFSFVLLGFALFTKETAVGLPLVLLLYDIFYTRPLGLKPLLPHLVSFAMLAFYFAVRVQLFGGVGDIPSEVSLRLGWIVPKALWLLVHLLPLPFQLNPRNALLLAGALMVMLWTFWPAFRRDPALLRFAPFALLASYLAAGPAIIFNSTPRLLYASTAFFSIGVAGALVSPRRVAATAAPLRRMGQALAALATASLMVGGGLSNFRREAPQTVYASAITRHMLDAVRTRLPELAPGDKLLFITVPAACGIHTILYAGLNDWVSLNYGPTVRSHVLSEFQFASCLDPPKLSVVQPSENSFVVRLTGRGRIVLSQTALDQLNAGDSLKNRFSSVTLLESAAGTITDVFRREHPTATPKAVAIELNAAVTDSPGKNYYFYHDGRTLWWRGENGWTPAQPEKSARE